jgi:hypothetical protein
MAYSKQTWVNDDPSKPLSAGRMTHIEDGLFIAAATADSAAAAALAAQGGVDSLETLTTTGRLGETELATTIVGETADLYVPAALAMVVIYHGDDPDYPRTAGPGQRLWVGSVFPNNLIEGIDLYAAPGSTAPPAPPTIDTTDLVARFAARALNLSAGAAVTSWPVLEGSAGGGFTIAGAPTFRTSGAIEYVETDGVDDALSFVSARTQPFTTILVARTFALTSGLTLFGSTSGSTALSTIGITSGNFVAYAGSNLTGTAADYGWHVFSVVYNGASSSLRIDGVEVATGNPGSNTSAGIRHGANSSLSSFFRIGVCESIHYTGAKDDTFLDAVEAELMSAYGIS